MKLSVVVTSWCIIERKGIGVPMEQALDKEYNKSAKCPGGVIEITRKKWSIAKWNLLKHEKSKYTHFLDDLCKNKRLEEYSVHHEFSTTQTKKDEKDIQTIKNYIASKCKVSNPGKLIHTINSVTLPDEEADNCIKRSEKHNLEYRESRIIGISKSLFDTISLK